MFLLQSGVRMFPEYRHNPQSTLITRLTVRVGYSHMVYLLVATAALTDTSRSCKKHETQLTVGGVNRTLPEQVQKSSTWWACCTVPTDTHRFASEQQLCRHEHSCAFWLNCGYKAQPGRTLNHMDAAIKRETRIQKHKAALRQLSGQHWLLMEPN